MDSILCHNVLTMKRCVIIGGAPIKEYARVRAYFSAEDDYVFCDSGLRLENSRFQAFFKITVLRSPVYCR